MIRKYNMKATIGDFNWVATISFFKLLAAMVLLLCVYTAAMCLLFELHKLNYIIETVGRSLIAILIFVRFCILFKWIYDRQTARLGESGLLDNRWSTFLGFLAPSDIKVKYSQRDILLFVTAGVVSSLGIIVVVVMSVHENIFGVIASGSLTGILISLVFVVTMTIDCLALGMYIRGQNEAHPPVRNVL